MQICENTKIYRNIKKYRLYTLTLDVGYVALSRLKSELIKINEKNTARDSRKMWLNNAL